MKRSRIFLGLTTTCLAIAGVVAAKASHFGAHSGYIATANGGGCVVTITPCIPMENGTKVCRTIVELIRPYCTFRTFGGGGLKTKCIHFLYYNEM